MSNQNESVEFVLQAHLGNDEWTKVATSEDLDELLAEVYNWQPNTHGTSVKGISGWAWIKQNDLRIIRVVTTIQVCYTPRNLGCVGIENAKKSEQKSPIIIGS